MSAATPASGPLRERASAWAMWIRGVSSSWWQCSASDVKFFHLFWPHHATHLDATEQHTLLLSLVGTFPFPPETSLSKAGLFLQQQQ